MANRIFELPETKKGVFQVRGIVNGCESQRYYTDKKTKNGNDFRSVNFGVKYDEDKTVYTVLNGMPRPNVYFTKRNPDGKNETKAVPWAQRMKDQGKDWNIIGVTMGLVKITNDEGKEVNYNVRLAEYDAAKYIKDNLEDDMSVFVRGNVEHSSYTTDKGEIRRQTRFVPAQVSRCKDVEFDDYDENNKPKHHFTETIIFMGIEKETDIDGKDTGRFVVSGKVVTYSSIEDVEYIIEDRALASLFKKNLKQYWSIEVSGQISVVHQVEEVDNSDNWGEANVMEKKQSGKSHTELLITGAKPSTIDRDTYTEKNIDEAMKKINASKNAEEKYADKKDDSASWGTDSAIDSDDEVDW